MNLYVTADRIGIETGGGAVTANEVAALRSLGPCEVWGREQLEGPGEDPWKWDAKANEKLWVSAVMNPLQKLIHFYAGTFSETAKCAKAGGILYTCTADAHDVRKSKQAHLELGLTYDYPHLIDPVLWKRYLSHYAAADVLIVPSTHSRDVMRNFGCENRIEIIPHGCTIPEKVAPLPETFVVGYLGQIGADKGVRYLLEAWKKLNYRDAVLLLAGSQSTSPFMRQLIHQFGGGNIQLMGWVKDVADFYNSISVYVQPSVTEGFGIEVLEAMAHGRAVICSDGAGAADCVRGINNVGMVCDACDVDDLAHAINCCYKSRDQMFLDGMNGRATAQFFTWPKIQELYAALWKELIK
jgi:glycosyltransferase involved in cell wall biosynthesis